MDLISAITDQLGVQGPQAKALAGSLFGAVESELDDSDTAQFQQAIPELEDWKSEASKIEPQPGGAAGLLGSLSGALGASGGAEVTALIAVAEKVGLDADKAKLIAPIAWSFLEKRLPPDLLGKVRMVAPFLSGGAGASGIAGLVGGLLG